MSSIIKAQSRQLRRRARQTSELPGLLSPLSPHEAGERLDVSLHGRRANRLLITREATRSRFEGGVDAPTFWLQSKSASYNPMERRIEGELLPCAGQTEVRAELRSRPAATVAVGAAVGGMALFTVVAVPIAILVDSLPLVGGAGRAALLTLLAGLWALLGVALWGLRRVGRDGEDRAARFLVSVLEVPDRDLLGY